MPTAALPPVTPLTCQVTLLEAAPAIVAVKACVPLPAVSVALVGARVTGKVIAGRQALAPALAGALVVAGGGADDGIGTVRSPRIVRHGQADRELAGGRSDHRGVGRIGAGDAGAAPPAFTIDHA